MNTASLALCKELYELSGWAETEKHWYIDQEQFEAVRTITEAMKFFDGERIEYRVAPAYDLGYLLRKLPERSISLIKKVRIAGLEYAPSYSFYYKQNSRGRQVSCEADNPEDSAARLCIELFKQGVLQS